MLVFHAVRRVTERRNGDITLGLDWGKEAELHYEDGKTLAIIEVDDPAQPDQGPGIAISIKGYDIRKRNPAVTGLIGKTIRVTVEIVEDTGGH